MQKRSGATMSRCRSVGVNPDVLEAMITSAPACRLTSASTRCLSGKLLGDVLLDEVRGLRHLAGIGREGEFPLRRKRREGKLGERRFRVCDGAAEPLLHFRLDVGGDHIDAEVQRARRPAAPDHTRPQKTESLDLPHHVTLLAHSDLYNILTII